VGNVHLTVRLRPTRFGFLVAPGDMKALDAVFRLCACLWGGKYNPIIPVFANRPSWWSRHGREGETAAQIVDGYLDYFEPDVLVETASGQADGLGYATDRVISVERLVPPAERLLDGYSESHGLGVGSLYRHLFEKEFQFARRLPRKVVRVKAGDASLEPMAACIFGGFPREGAFHELEAMFDEVFAPEALTLDAGLAADIFSNNWTNPLHVGHDGLEVRYGSWNDPAIFVFDASRPSDLIDYWNLRAGVAPVVPVPLQFADELSEFAREFVRRNHRPLPHNQHGVMIRPRVMFARSIPSDDVRPLFERHFRVEVEGANAVQDWYPPLWRRSSEIAVAPTRPTVTAATSEHHLDLRGDETSLQFDCPVPEFADGFGGRSRWAHAVRMDDWTFSDRYATTYPDGYRDPKRPNFGGALGEVLTTSEGFVTLADYSIRRQFWQLETNASAMATWLRERSVAAELSGSGRATRQIIETLGSLRGVSAVADAGVVQLLNGMARRPISRSMEHHQFRNRVRDAMADRLWGRGAATTLIEKGAVELGLEVRCDKCGGWGWYPLDGLGACLRCIQCLKGFGFPMLDPGAKGSARWAYRVVGPFAQPDYAQGGYAAALSIRFFADVLRSSPAPGLTWSAGQELALADGDRIEADFLLWYRRGEMFGHRSRTELVLGEAKSFGHDAFGVDDVARMRRLALAFPGSVLVFSTMKAAGELTKGEIARLGGIARWGRHWDARRRRTRAPVVLLTATELFAEHSLSRAWEAAGGEHARLVGPAYVRPDNLRVLADLTQQLYLGLEPYHAAVERRWARRRSAGEAADRPEGDGGSARLQ